MQSDDQSGARVVNRLPQLLRYGAGALILVLLPLLLPLMPGVSANYLLYLLCLTLIYALVAVGLNLLIGFAGQFSLGHAGFLAIGAYTSAILTQRFGWHFVLALPAAGLFTAAIGFLLGLPALRLSGPYLAVVTLGFGLAIPQLIVYFEDLTGGTQGLRELPFAAIPIWFDGATLYNLELSTEREMYYLVLGILAALTLFAVRLVDSHTGRAFVAIRDSELAAQAMGVNLTRYKTTAFALSAFYAGVAGSLYAHLIRFLAPESFTLFLSIEFLIMIVVGGLGSIRGALFGTLIIIGLQELLNRLPLVREHNLYIIVFGALLILTIMFLPHGLAGALHGRGLRRPGTQHTAPPDDAAAPDLVEEARDRSSMSGSVRRSVE
ncbi:MAG TPA: branched-chain amino acid ABC transporter permease [Roseiflexaceae bacterium]|nr:branched-chain amino acid ABC transporter permease [Roseiflexaceae bacterium]